MKEITGKHKIRFYKLDDNKNVVECSMFESEEFIIDPKNKIIEETSINDVRISTVFLPIDHFLLDIPHRPVVFETMIFGGKHDLYQERYCIYDEAVEGHKKAVEMVRNN